MWGEGGGGGGGGGEGGAGRLLERAHGLFFIFSCSLSQFGEVLGTRPRYIFSIFLIIISVGGGSWNRLRSVIS